jgi:hypothetical protein
MYFDKESQQILKSISSNSFKMRDHTIRRCDERLLTRNDVINISKTVFDWRWQEDKYTHRFLGLLNDGTTGGMTVIVDKDSQQTWVVTIFKRRLSTKEKEMLKRNNDGN